jgi:Phage replication protein CRI
LQVDWVSGEVSSQSIIAQGIKLYDTGRMLVLGPGGEVTQERAGLFAFEGSHDNRLAICSRDGASVYVSGNPAKFFQGHNLFGSTDVDGLYLAAGIAIRQGVGLFPGPATFASCEFTRPRYTRIDLTRSYRFTSNDRARAWLRDVAATARTRHGSAGLGRDGSITFGKGSRRWSFTVYPKFDELQARGRGHALSSKLPETAVKQLQEWAEGIVRFELRLRSLELASAWPITDPLATWSQYFDRIQFNRNNLASMGNDMLTETLPSHLLGYLARWKVGEDLRRNLAHNTYYRVRRDLLKHAGVDIASPPNPDTRVAFTAGTLPPQGWDPEPLTEHLYEPGDELKRSYGLL